MGEPFETQCSNDRDDRWTTPCCYGELGNCGPGTHECPKCGRSVECTTETFTSSVCTLADDSEQ